MVKYISLKEMKMGPVLYKPGMEIPAEEIAQLRNVDAFISMRAILRIGEGRPLTIGEQRLLRDAQRDGVPEAPIPLTDNEKPKAPKGIDKIKPKDGFTREELLEGHEAKTKPAPGYRDSNPIPLPKKFVDPLKMAQEAVSTFDPSTKTVREVVDYIKANPEQADAVLAREAAGKNRPRVKEWLDKE